MIDFEITISCDVYPDFTKKVSGAYDFRLAVAKIMGDWNLYCQKMKKDTTPEVRKLIITTTVI
mgnify:CR=1 FL=1